MGEARDGVQTPRCPAPSARENRRDPRPLSRGGIAGCLAIVMGTEGKTLVAEPAQPPASPPAAASKVSIAALGAWLLVVVYYFYQYALRSSPSVMMPQLTDRSEERRVG